MERTIISNLYKKDSCDKVEQDVRKANIRKRVRQVTMLKKRLFGEQKKYAQDMKYFCEPYQTVGAA